MSDTENCLALRSIVQILDGKSQQEFCLDMRFD